MVENLFVGHRVTDGRGSFARINWSAERERAREIFESYGVDLDPSAQVGRLRPTSQALLAIVRAAEELREYRREHEQGGGVLVLDEPTVFLPEHEKVFLFDLVRRVVAEGFGVLFVSHDMTAVREIANRAVVLRDGAKVGDVPVATASDADLIELVSGHRLDRSTIERATTYGSGATAETSGDVVLSVKDVRGGRVRGITFDLHAGEILGIAGLLGSGSEDLPYVLFGGVDDAAGEVSLPDWSGDASEIAPSKSIARGVALVPADRKQQGAVADLPVGAEHALAVAQELHAGRHSCASTSCRDRQSSVPRPMTCARATRRSTCRRCPAATSRRSCSRAGSSRARECCCCTSRRRESTSPPAIRSTS